MDNDKRHLDFDSLSERISAQTQAYVEFSNALVRVIESMAEIRDQAVTIHQDQMEEFKELVKTIESLTQVLEKSEIQNLKRHIESIIDNQKEHKITIESIVNKVSVEVDNSNRFYSFWNRISTKVQNFFLALVFLLVVIQALVQLNLLHFNWGK